MNWGKGIAIAFILFAAYIGFLVVITLREDFYLVSEDYYKKEIEYQQQINREVNHSKLQEKPTIVFVAQKNELVISFPASIKPSENGIIHLFRPSNAEIDKKFSLILNDGIQRIPLNNMAKGLWKVKFNWNWKGEEYYQEQTIVI